MTTVARRRQTYSPAALTLLGHGGTVTELADGLGTTQSAASKYLAGSRRMPEDLPGVLSDLIGPVATAEVLALIPAKAKAA